MRQPGMRGLTKSLKDGTDKDVSENRLASLRGVIDVADLLRRRTVVFSDMDNLVPTGGNSFERALTLLRHQLELVTVTLAAHFIQDTNTGHHTDPKRRNGEITSTGDAESTSTKRQLLECNQAAWRDDRDHPFLVRFWSAAYIFRPIA